MTPLLCYIYNLKLGAICVYFLTRDNLYYRQISELRRTLIGNKIVGDSDVVGAWAVGAAPTTFSFSI